MTGRPLDQLALANGDATGGVVTGAVAGCGRVGVLDGEAEPLAADGAGWVGLGLAEVEGETVGVELGVGFGLGEVRGFGEVPGPDPPPNTVVPLAGWLRTASASGLPATSSTAVTTAKMVTKITTVRATNIWVRPKRATSRDHRVGEAGLAPTDALTCA